MIHHMSATVPWSQLSLTPLTPMSQQRVFEMCFACPVLRLFQEDLYPTGWKLVPALPMSVFPTHYQIPPDSPREGIYYYIPWPLHYSCTSLYVTVYLQDTNALYHLSVAKITDVPIETLGHSVEDEHLEWSA